MILRTASSAYQNTASTPTRSPLGHNPRSPRLTVVADEHDHTPPPVLRESELVPLTCYVQGLNELAPPLPCRVAITGPRADGFAHEGDSLEITVIAEDNIGQT